MKQSRVLVIAPHPDDEAIGAGGTLALHQAARSTVLVVYISHNSGYPPGSSLAEDNSTRALEAQAAGGILGFSRQIFLRYPDGNLSRYEDKITDDLTRIIKEFKPEQIFCPFPSDQHRDHQAAALATSEATLRSGFTGEVWTYEVWSALFPNHGVDITGVVEKKREAINCYHSQLAYRPYTDAALGLNRFRGLRMQVDYAENFYTCGVHEFAKISRALNII